MAPFLSVIPDVSIETPLYQTSMAPSRVCSCTKSQEQLFRRLGKTFNEKIKTKFFIAA